MEKNQSKPKFKLNLLQALFIVAGLIWVFNIFGTVYILPDIPKLTADEIREVIYKDTLTVPDIEFNKGKMIPGVAIENVSSSSDALVLRGSEVFKESCESCHGAEGRGDGAGGAMLNPKPRDFHDKDDWKNGREIAGMFKTLEEGIPGSGMNAIE